MRTTCKNGGRGPFITLRAFCRQTSFFPIYPISISAISRIDRAIIHTCLACPRVSHSSHARFNRPGARVVILRNFVAERYATRCGECAKNRGALHFSAIRYTKRRSSYRLRSGMAQKKTMPSKYSAPNIRNIGRIRSRSRAPVN